MEISENLFVRNNENAKIWRMPASLGHLTIRFYDTSPISPSEKYIAVTEIPLGEKRPTSLDAAVVKVIELRTGDVIYEKETYAWDIQLGAQVQWGKTDQELFFNHRVGNFAKATLVNIFNATQKYYDSSIYMISPDATKFVSSCLSRYQITQKGYGLINEDHSVSKNTILGGSKSDGMTITNVSTGKHELIVTFDRIYKTLFKSSDRRFWLGRFYGAHTKWNHDSSKIMFVFRFCPSGPKVIHRYLDRSSCMSNFIAIYDTVSDKLNIALDTCEWTPGSHHPNWFPNSNDIIMNINYPDLGLKFVKISADGKEKNILRNDVFGSGHPTVSPNGRFILTDAYMHESFQENGAVPLRLIDLETNNKICLDTPNIRPPFRVGDPYMRVDPHPAWSPSGKYISYNCVMGRKRTVNILSVAGAITE